MAKKSSVSIFPLYEGNKSKIWRNKVRLQDSLRMYARLPGPFYADSSPFPAVHDVLQGAKNKTGKQQRERERERGGGTGGDREDC